MTDNQPRIESLRAQHAKADEKVRAMQLKPGHCPSILRGLKAEKLRLKDEIAALEAEEAGEHHLPELQVLEGDQVSPTLEPPVEQKSVAA